MRREDAVARSICRIQDFRFLCSSRCFVLFLSRDASLFQCLGPGSQVAWVFLPRSLFFKTWISRGAERGEQWVPEGRLINCAHTRLTFFFFRLPPMITTVCAKEMHHHPQQGCRGTAGDDKRAGEHARGLGQHGQRPLNYLRWRSGHSFGTIDEEKSEAGRSVGRELSFD